MLVRKRRHWHAREKLTLVTKGLAVATKKDIERFLEETELDPYQSMPLPYGLATSGRSRFTEVEELFPRDIAGLSVLDVGTNYGFSRSKQPAVGPVGSSGSSRIPSGVVSHERSPSSMAEAMRSRRVGPKLWIWERSSTW